MSLLKDLHFYLSSFSITNLCKEYSLYFTRPQKSVLNESYSSKNIFVKSETSFVNQKHVIIKCQGHWTSGCGSQREEHETDFSAYLPGEGRE